MNSAAQLDETYHFILSVFVGRGQAPHYTEIASSSLATKAGTVSASEDT